MRQSRSGHLIQSGQYGSGSWHVGRELRELLILQNQVVYLQHPEHDWCVTDHTETIRAVMPLASEKPDWLPVLQAACESARKAEAFGGEFASSWVISELERQTDGRVWLPCLRTLAVYGLIEKSGPSARGGRRAYYRMADRAGVELGIEELKRRIPPGAR